MFVSAPQVAEGENSRDIGAAEAAAATVVSQTPPLAQGKEALRAAAFHCVVLDETGEFPTDRVLGAFVVALSNNDGDGKDFAQTPGGVLEPTAGQVELVVRRPTTSVGDDPPSTSSMPGVVGVSVSLEVAISAPGPFDSEEGRPPSRNDEINAVTEAAVAASVIDPAGAQTAIAALACWNLMVATNVPAVRVSVAAVFGNHGDWYTAERVIALTPSTDNVLQQPIFNNTHDGHKPTTWLKTSLDWEPPGIVWDRLEGPVVADVVISTADVFMFGLSSEPLFLHATLCKRAGWTSGLRANVILADEQPLHVRRAADRIGGVHAIPEHGAVVQDSAISDSTRWNVVEMDDPEWTSEAGRGMEVVRALPRLVNWIPGQWRERQKRRQQQEAENERRRAQEIAYRQREASRGSESRSGGSSSGHNASNTNPGVVSKAVRAVKRRWRKLRRKVWQARQKNRKKTT